MDINDFRALATVLMFVAFMGIVWWAYGPSRKAYFNQAAQLPFDADDEDEKHQHSTKAPVPRQQGEQA